MARWGGAGSLAQLPIAVTASATVAMAASVAATATATATASASVTGTAPVTASATVIATATAGLVRQSEDPRPAAGFGLEVARLYNGADQSIDIRVTVPPPPERDVERDPSLENLERRLTARGERAVAAERAAEQARRDEVVDAYRPPEVRIALMRHDGTVVRRSAPIEAGEHDLAALLPDVFTIRFTTWVQLTADGIPVGTPLVLQPMLGPLVALPAEAVSPSGARTSRIEAWVTEDHAWDGRRDVLGAGRAVRRAIQAALDAVQRERGDADAASADGDSAERNGSGADDGGAPGASGAPGSSGAVATGADAWPALPPSDDARVGPAVVDAFDAAREFAGFRVYADAQVRLDTDLGSILIELRPDAAPNTAWNFRHLAGGGYYRFVPFHRVVPMTPTGDPFVIQAGDPSGTGSGGPGYWLPAERSPLPHEAGTVSMARDIHPDSAGGQFFICLSRAGTARLDGDYTAFGMVVDGAVTVQDIAAVPLADVERGRPRTPPLIRRAVLVPAPPRALARPAGDASEVEAPRPTRVPR